MDFDIILTVIQIISIAAGTPAGVIITIWKIRAFFKKQAEKNWNEQLELNKRLEISINLMYLNLTEANTMQKIMIKEIRIIQKHLKLPMLSDEEVQDIRNDLQRELDNKKIEVINNINRIKRRMKEIDGNNNFSI